MFLFNNIRSVRVLAMVSAMVSVMASVMAISGCASNGNQQVQITPDEQFDHLLADFKKDPESVSYLSLWNSYLASSQTDNTAVSHDNYIQLSQQIEQGALQCTSVDWEAITRQNFWSLKPHESAQNCYEQAGQPQLAAYHDNAINFLVTGILSSGNGESDYAAYEVATWGDAEDVIEFAGYEVVDSYLTFKRQRQVVYKVYVVNDLDSGFQKSVYFENARFLHQFLGIQYPFAGIGDQLYLSLVEAMPDTLTMAKAEVLYTKGQLDESIQLFLDAYNNGSAVASYWLAVACLQPKQERFNSDDCIDFAIQSAEQDFLDGALLLAYLYKEGLGVEASEQTYLQLLTAVQSRLSDGEAWYRFGSHYKGAFAEKDLEKRQEYVRKAAQMGYMQAEYELALKALNAQKDTQSEAYKVALARISLLAEKGFDKAQTIYASRLIRSNTQGSAQTLAAKEWLELAIAQHYPYASNVMGDAYHSGAFGQKDNLEAFLAYSRSALDYIPYAQLRVGFFNDWGFGVESDKELAFLWYFLCASAMNSTCINNVGIFFENGLGVEQDYAKAMVFFKLAAEQKNVSSYRKMAGLYFYGNGVDKDLTKAVSLYERGCEQGDGDSCWRLGKHYADGMVLTKDIERANQLYKQACANGKDIACDQSG